MTEDTPDDDAQQNDQTNDNNSGISRRGFLAAGLASPAVAGLGLGAFEANARSTAVSDIVKNPSQSETDRSLADVTVGFPMSEGPDSLAEAFTTMTADPALLDALDLDVGQQVRVRRNDDEYAAYTISETRQEQADETVRMGRRARCRLALGELDWEDTGDKHQSCPTYKGNTSLSTEQFDAVVDPVVPAQDLTVEEAHEQDELVEQLEDDAEARLVVCAPHGGDIEPHTDTQAERFTAAYDDPTTTWTCHGFRDNGGAFVRWHVPSTQLTPASFPKLASIADRGFRVGVSFHGTCTARVRVGGGASEETKTEISDAINAVLPDSAPDAVVARGRYAATDEDVLVNRLSGGDGIWIGQPEDVRANHGDAVAEAVADVANRRV